MWALCGNSPSVPGAILALRFAPREADPLMQEFERSIEKSNEVADDNCVYEIRWTLEAPRSPASGSAERKPAEDVKPQPINQRSATSASVVPARNSAAKFSDMGRCLALPRIDRSYYPTDDWTYNIAASNLRAPTISLPMLAVEGIPLRKQVIGWKDEHVRVVGMGRWITARLQPGPAFSIFQPPANSFLVR
jgi:hypothetical protein